VPTAIAVRLRAETDIAFTKRMFAAKKKLVLMSFRKETVFAQIEGKRSNYAWRCAAGPRSGRNRK